MNVSPPLLPTARRTRKAQRAVTLDPADLGTVLGLDYRLEVAALDVLAAQRFSAARALGSGWLARLRRRG
jgi:hypothetical protein